MAKIECEVHLIEMKDDYGNTKPGVRVCCGECGHQAEAFGRKKASVNYAFVKLRESCADGPVHYYIGEDGYDKDLTD